MKPPDHILKDLERIHKWARLGWWVPNDGNPDGVYSLLQLYHVRDANRTIVQPWNRRGPVYGKPFDGLMRVPMWIRDIDPRDIHSGAFITMIREWMRPMNERYEESSQEAWKNLDAELTDHAEGMGDYVWNSSKRTGASPGVTAQKFLDPKKKAIMAGDYDRTTAKNLVTTPTPKNAVKMA